MNKGFTLIETVVYIALFSILMVGAFVTAFELLRGSDSLSSKTVTQDEVNMVLRKIDWALSGTSPLAVVTSPSATILYTASLSLKRSDGTQIDIRKNGSKIEMRSGGSGSPYLPITTDNVTVTGLGFHYLSPIGSGAPSGVEATTTISGISATTTAYVRK